VPCSELNTFILFLNTLIKHAIEKKELHHVEYKTKIVFNTIVPSSIEKSINHIVAEIYQSHFPRDWYRPQGSCYTEKERRQHFREREKKKSTYFGGP